MKRSKFIGGSDVAAILGLSRYKTPYEVWDEKKNGNNPFTGNNVTEWGLKLEPVIITHFEQQHGIKVRDNNTKFISNKHDFIGCHPDGIFKRGGEDWLLEIKTVSSNAFRHWGNDIPLEYYCQIQHNMSVCGLTKAVLAYLVLDSRSYEEIEIVYDAEFVEKQTNYIVEWWNRYIIGDEIPLKIVDDFERSDPNVSIVEASSEARELHGELLAIKSKIKELTKHKEIIEDKLKLEIGDNTDLMSGLETLCTWRAKSTVRVDTKKLKEEQPEVFLKYAKETKSRTFLIKIN